MNTGESLRHRSHSGAFWAEPWNLDGLYITLHRLSEKWPEVSDDGLDAEGPR